MRKLKDIRENLEKDIDIQTYYDMGEPHVLDSIEPRNTGEITMKKKDISLQKTRDIHIQKNRTRNFDSVGPKSFRAAETIDITKKSVFTRIKERNTIYVIGAVFMIVICFFISISVIEQRVNSGYEKLLHIQDHTISISGVRKDINDARFDFTLSDILFTPFKLFSSHSINTGYHAIKGGKMLTKSGDKFLQVYEKTLGFFEKKPLQDIRFTQLFQNIHEDFIRIEDSLVSALYHYYSIPPIGDEDIQAMLDSGIDRLEFVAEKVAVINNNFSVFLDIFGHSGRRNYLIAFQNSDEIRPTGGFMGSMGVISVFRGQIQSFTPRDVYSFEWDLKRSDFQRVSPPKGIDVLTSSFGLRDANYYINLKDSSEAIKFFVEKSGQQIDGVIYINQNILLDLLEVTQGVYFEGIDTEITAENFSEIMSLLVESKIYKKGTQGTPKQVLFDFMDTFTRELLTQKQYSSYLTTLIHHIESRDIMMYSFKKNENTLLKDLHIGGEINYSDSFDFSYPVFTSLSGNKSDRYMDRSFIKEINFVNTCDIKTSLSMVSRHTFNTEKQSYMKKLIDDYQVQTENILSIQGAGNNYQFVRMILPKNSEIELQEGMDIRDYGQRKGVEFFLRTRPTETSTYTINYTLKNPDCIPYTYSHYKQPGIQKYDIQITSDQRQERFTGLEEDFFYSKR